jgi:hypothetical protein
MSMNTIINPANPTATAAIYWHRSVPTERYNAPMRTDYQSKDEGAWSLMCDYRGYGLWTVWFLAPTGPHHWLIKGLRFELFEGERVVANGTIVDA